MRYLNPLSLAAAALVAAAIGWSMTQVVAGGRQSLLVLPWISAVSYTHLTLPTILRV